MQSDLERLAFHLDPERAEAISRDLRGLPGADLGLVLGANLGSGLLAVLTTARSSVEVRQVPLGNLVFKVVGVVVALPLIGLWLRYARPYIPERATVVVLFLLSSRSHSRMVSSNAVQARASVAASRLPALNCCSTKRSSSPMRFSAASSSKTRLCERGRFS